MLSYPHNIDAERCVIGCLMMGATDERLIGKHFYHETHQRLFELIVDMRKREVPCDAVTVRHEAAKNGLTVAGTDIVRFLECVTQTCFMASYVEIVIECYRRRRMVELAEWLIRRSADATADVDETWDKVGGEVVRQKKLSGSK